MRIALIDFHRTNDVHWTLGARLLAGSNVQELNLQIRSLKETSDFILFYHSERGLPTRKELQSITESRGDLWHGGAYSIEQAFSFLGYIRPCWMLDLFPNGNIECVSWRINSHSALIPVHFFENYGLLSEAYSSIQAAFLDWGFTVVNNGGIPLFKPELSDDSRNEISIADQMIFLQRSVAKFWIRWSLWRAFNNGDISFKALFKYWWVRKLKRDQVEGPVRQEVALESEEKTPSISVVIITLNRYTFLKNVVQQLSVQSIPVSEILVVDASPLNVRITEWVSEFNDGSVPIHVLYSEIIGQCTQRNMAIEKAVGELIYFCDDDMEEIPPNHLERHLHNIAKYRADVSSGLPDEVGHVLIDRRKLKTSISGVFPTNDTLVYKSKVLEAGLFDVKMDRGQSEDHDLGIRIYLTGGIMILDPKLKSLHLRAGSGGLREHGVRLVTSGSSRSNFFKFRLLHTTEIYLNLKYFGKKKVYELLLINLFATGSIRGDLLKRVIKMVIAILYLPLNYVALRRSYLRAINLLDRK